MIYNDLQAVDVKIDVKTAKEKGHPKRVPFGVYYYRPTSSFQVFFPTAPTTVRPCVRFSSHHWSVNRTFAYFG